jgi:hypothetical protein
MKKTTDQVAQGMELHKTALRLATLLELSIVSFCSFRDAPICPRLVLSLLVLLIVVNQQYDGSLSWKTD